MKKAFGMIEILIVLCIIGIMFALFHSSNPIVENYARVDKQKQKADEMVEQVTKLKEQNLKENQAIINNIDE